MSNTRKKPDLARPERACCKRAIAAFIASTGRVAKRGWDTLSEKELVFMVKHHGELPPGRTLEELDRVVGERFATKREAPLDRLYKIVSNQRISVPALAQLERLIAEIEGSAAKPRRRTTKRA